MLVLGSVVAGAFCSSHFPPVVRLEMRYLSKVTGDEVFASKTMKFYVRILKLLVFKKSLVKVVGGRCQR